MQKTSKFMAVAAWVLDSVVDDVPKHTKATAEVRGKGPHNSGNLVLSAETREELEKAVEYIARHDLYKVHFSF